MFTPPPPPANDLLPFAVLRVVTLTADGETIRPGTPEDAVDLARAIAEDLRVR
jgi:hypothetical protein